MLSQDYSPTLTRDGSISLYSKRFLQSFHSMQGAYRETIEKFVVPLQLENLQERFLAGKDVLRILDVGLGMGYNTAAVLDVASKRSMKVCVHALDLSLNPLRYALGVQGWRVLFAEDVLAFLDGLLQECSSKKNIVSLSGDNMQIAVHLGDARKTVAPLLKESFHAVLYDPFSAKTCPELWTHEILGLVLSKLAKGGRLVSYSVAAAFRNSLISHEMDVYSVKPAAATSKAMWSIGTVAKKGDSVVLWRQDAQICNSYATLTLMEKEHLQTKAAIFYRDPHLCSTSKEIQSCREAKQLASKLPSASVWRGKWLTCKQKSRN